MDAKHHRRTVHLTQSHSDFMTLSASCIYPTPASSHFRIVFFVRIISFNVPSSMGFMANMFNVNLAHNINNGPI